jgi:hypothetical protein
MTEKDHQIVTMSFLETLSVIALAFFVWGSH